MCRDLPRVVLKEDEKVKAPEEDEAEWYADHENVPPALMPYVIMGYGPRIQLMLLFSRSRRAITLGEVFRTIEGDDEAIARQMNYLLGLEIIEKVRIGVFKFNYNSPIAQELDDLFYELTRQAMSWDPEEFYG